MSPNIVYEGTLHMATNGPLPTAAPLPHGPAVTNTGSMPFIPCHIHTQGPQGFDPCNSIAGFHMPPLGPTIQLPLQSHCPYWRNIYDCHAWLKGHCGSRPSQACIYIGRNPARHHLLHRRLTSQTPQQSSHTNHTTETGFADYMLWSECTLTGSIQHLSPVLCRGVMWENPTWSQMALSTQHIPLLSLLNKLHLS
jgi:hypothetical protein